MCLWCSDTICRLTDFFFFSKCIKKHHVTDQYFRLHKHSFLKIMYTSISLILICSVNNCFHYLTMHLCLILTLLHCKLWFTKLIMSQDPHKISISVSPVTYIKINIHKYQYIYFWEPIEMYWLNFKKCRDSGLNPQCPQIRDTPLLGQM